ncbi:MAG: hypothetical protein JW724_01265 [Candidatus Altiarchaeota archaeon]|nr:hypothetical protein [Candidatus Altiarchaeota archaeon]
MAKTDITTELKARGLLFKILTDWFSDRFGSEISKELKPDLDKETLDTLDSAEKGGWYPAERLIDTLTVCAQKPGASADCLSDFGSYLCHVSLTTSFRGLIVFIDPMTLMKRMPLFWRRYFNGVDLKAEQVSQADAVLSLEYDIGKGLIGKMFSGWLTQALEMIGANEIKVDEADFRWDVSWQWSPD